MGTEKSKLFISNYKNRIMNQQKLSTKYFITKFRLDQENYEYDREEFLSTLNDYFLSRIDAEELVGKSTTDGFNYKKFKNCVDQTEKKFWAISNKKVGLPLTPGLWSAFFAIYVTPLRLKLFPEVQQYIEDNKVDKHIQITDLISSKDLLGLYQIKVLESETIVNIARFTKTLPPRGKHRVNKSEKYYKLIDDKQTSVITLPESSIEYLHTMGQARLVDSKTKLETIITKL